MLKQSLALICLAGLAITMTGCNSYPKSTKHDPFDDDFRNPPPGYDTTLISRVGHDPQPVSGMHNLWVQVPVTGQQGITQGKEVKNLTGYDFDEFYRESNITLDKVRARLDDARQ